MNPFTIHREAFERMRVGDLCGAERRFAEALRMFGRAAASGAFRQTAAARAALIPTHSHRADEVAGEFVSALPGWLRDYHFQNYCDALSQDRADIAAAHWRLLELASKLPVLGPQVDLAGLRGLVCSRFHATQELLDKSENERPAVLSQAERILAADPGNMLARKLAIEGYSGEVGDALDRLSGTGTSAERALKKLTSVSRRHYQGRMRKAARHLRRHLAATRGAPTASIQTMTRSFQCLCLFYLGSGDSENAMRMLRRARRYGGDDPEFQAWARRVRRLGRSR